MNERFDDIIRRRLEGHESNVPEGMFDAISNRPEVLDAFFDAAIKNKLVSAENKVPDELFDAVSAAAELEHLGFDSALKAKLEPYVSTTPAAIFDSVTINADLKHLGFDSSVQGKLESYSSAVPADMWQRIMAEKERRRRPVAWWWMAATVLLLLGGAGTAFLLKKEKPTVSITASQRKTSQQPGSVLSEKPVPEKEVDTDAFNQKTAVEKRDAIAVAETAMGTRQKVDGDKLPKANPVASLNERAANTWKNGKKNNGTIPAGTAYETTNEVTNNLQPATTLQATEDASLATAHLSILELLRNAGRLAPGQLLKAKPHAPVIPCPTNGDEKRNDWYVDVYGSAFLLQKTIYDKNAGKNAKAGFDTTLHQQVSFNAGINLVKNIGENFLLKTGLQYNRINESFRLTQINERRLITTISVRTVILSPGDTVRIRDTSIVEQIGTAQHRTQNRYAQLDIPMIIGYEFGGENMRLNINAGIIANIRSSYSGEMLADSTKQIFDINNYNGKPIYRKTVGFSLYAGLSILKPLTEKMSLLIEPHARIGLGNTANSQTWFSQKNSTMGLSIGLRYKFSGGRQRIY